MATLTLETRPQLDVRVKDVLGRLRAQVRRYVGLDGLAAAAIWLGTAFWASLAIDWLFEPAQAVRGLMLATVAVVFLGVMVRLILLRLLVPLSDSNLATLLERRFQKLDDTLLTAVVLTNRELDPDECNPHMLARTCREAAQRIGDIELREVFNPVPLRRRTGGAVLLAVSVVAFASLFPQAMGVWARRNLAFSDELWPRRTHLVVEGIRDGVVKVARGGDFTLIAKAATRDDQDERLSIPQVVTVYYCADGGQPDHRAMTREAAVDPEKDPFQEYSYTFRDMRASHRVEVAGGDDRVRGLRIEVVDSPTITEMSLDCRYPAYLGRGDRTLPVTGVMQFPFGSRLTLHARANKELEQVRIETAEGGPAGEAGVCRAAAQRSPDRRGFAYALPRLRQNSTLLFFLSDVDGIAPREPVRLSLVAVADEPPQLSVRLDGIGTAITPAARLPLAGQVTDDYGIDKVWAEATIDRRELPPQPVAMLPAHPTTHVLHHVAIEAAELKVAPGQKLLFSVKASDLYDLGSGANVGSSERWLLDVVTPEQMRTMLDARELVLRQRFEAIIEEVTETHDLLARIEFAPAAKAKDGGRARKDNANKDDADKDDANKQHSATAAGRKPGDSAGSEPGEEQDADLPVRQRTMHVERALTNARKNTQEILAVAESFDDIRLQLINNRIDTEELIRRLQAGIAQPLRHVATGMFPPFEQRLLRLQANLDDAQAGPENGSRAVQQAAEILAAMQAVLEVMAQLETFNEAVDMLRALIKSQDTLDAQTKQRHKQTIRDLLEDK